MSLFEKYEVELTLVRDQLGTNPMDPAVMDKHVLDRQRKLIMEKSDINNTVNKYLKALQISKETGDNQIDGIIAAIEETIGYVFTPEERIKVMAGDLKFLKETFAELDIKGTTVFFWNREKKRPMIAGHMILGFLKAASEAISRTRTKKQKTMLHSDNWGHTVINQYVRVQEEFITFDKDLKRDEEGNPFYFQRSLRAESGGKQIVALAKSELVEAGAKLKFVLKVFTGGGTAQIQEDHLKDMFEYGELNGLGQWRNAGHGQFTYTLKKIK